MTFAEKIQLLRKDRQLSQEQLAEYLDVSRQAVAKWEAGGTFPDLPKLLLLSDFFKISLDRLIKEDLPCGMPFQDADPIIPSDDYIKFLIRGKLACYAGEGAEVASSRCNSHDLAYQEGDLRYYDTYLGSPKFAGQEALWLREKPFWAMNYVGRVLSETFDGTFLKEALANVSMDSPFRGPSLYQRGDYTYHCSVSGDISWFYGSEAIYYLGLKIYECLFHGGLVE